MKAKIFIVFNKLLNDDKNGSKIQKKKKDF